MKRELTYTAAKWSGCSTRSTPNGGLAGGSGFNVLAEHSLLTGRDGDLLHHFLVSRINQPNLVFAGGKRVSAGNFEVSRRSNILTIDENPSPSRVGLHLQRAVASLR